MTGRHTISSSLRSFGGNIVIQSFLSFKVVIDLQFLFWPCIYIFEMSSATLLLNTVPASQSTADDGDHNGVNELSGEKD